MGNVSCLEPAPLRPVTSIGTSGPEESLAMTAANQLLDPKIYDSTRLGVMESETLPASVYTSEEIYTREVEQIFNKDWYVVGDATRISKPGDFFTVDYFGKSIIIVRGEDGSVRAFLNACRHRGTAIVSGEGNVERFACPYHSWVYSLDGTLLSSMEMQNTQGFEQQSFGLIPVRMESWGVFLFITFDHNAVSLSERLGDLPNRFELYDFDDLVCVRRKEWEVACNWKLLLENGMEELHVGTVHQKTIQQYAAGQHFRTRQPDRRIRAFAGEDGKDHSASQGRDRFSRHSQPLGEIARLDLLRSLVPKLNFCLYHRLCVVWAALADGSEQNPVGARRLLPERHRGAPRLRTGRATLLRSVGQDLFGRYRSDGASTNRFALSRQYAWSLLLIERNWSHDIANWWLDRLFGPSDSASAS